MDMVQMARCQIRQPLGQPSRRGMGEIVEGRIVVKRLELLGDRPDDLIAAMPDIDAP